MVETMATILLKGGTLVDGNGRRRGDVLVRDGRIAAIGPDIVEVPDAEVIDCSGKLVSEGFIDVHVHFREPGQSYKETIRTGSLAAAHGGYTTVCAMPNLNPVPDSPETLALEQEIIDRDACIRVLPYASITLGRKGEALVDFAALKDRCIAFSDDGSGVQRDAMMRSAMEAAAREDVVIAAHCEDNTLLHGGYIHDGRYCAAHGHKGICSESEWGQIKRDLLLCEETGCRYHVCHISCAESVELIRQAKARGVRVTCETGPHYLSLCEDDLQEDGRFKMNPPLRRAEDREALIEGLRDGTIDAIATDHAPHSADGLRRRLHRPRPDRQGLPRARRRGADRRAAPGVPPGGRPAPRRPRRPRGHRPRRRLDRRSGGLPLPRQGHALRRQGRPRPHSPDPQGRQARLSSIKPCRNDFSPSRATTWKRATPTASCCAATAS